MGRLRGRKPALVLVTALAALAAAAGLTWRAIDPGPPRYNLLLISIDSVVRDRLGPYGHRPQFAPELPVSPALDALAQESFVFDDAHANSSWTLPVHMSLMTGMADLGHQVVDDGHRLDPLRTTLAERFRAAGAATAGVYSGPYLDPRFGFDRGFDRYESAMMPPEQLERELDAWAAQRQLAGAEVDETMRRAMRERVSHYDVTSPRVAGMAADFLDQQDPAEPFFLFLHFFDAHFDYLPERMEAGLGRRFDPGYDGPLDGANWMFNPAVREVDGDGKTVQRRLSDRDLDHVRALYDAEIHWVDRHIGLVLEKLRQRGLDQRTIVCVFSDHGDEFFEHGSLGHRSTLFPELTEAALILRIPGQEGGGRRVADLVRLHDLAPTLLDYAGLAPLAEAGGASLRPLLEAGGEAPPPRETLQLLIGSRPRLETWRSADYAVHRVLEEDHELGDQHPGWLFLRQAKREDGEAMLYAFDRRTDPDEQRHLSRHDPRWQDIIERYRQAFLRQAERHQRLGRSAPAERTQDGWSAQEAAALEELGYLETDGARLIAPLPVPGEDRSAWRPDSE